MTRRPLHVVALLDHSDHRATPRCPCLPEPGRDLAEPAVSVYVHGRPVPIVSDTRRDGSTAGAVNISGTSAALLPTASHAHTYRSARRIVFLEVTR